MQTDVLIIGAGVFGLSIARALRAAGREVLVAEAEKVGSGASATPLGVLSPHTPDGWNPKKAAQFEALTTLPGILAGLVVETGFDVGYRRYGRLIPLPSAHLREIWKARIGDARERWQGQAAIEIVDRPRPDWLAPKAAPEGAALCGLSARIDARRYVSALAASVGKNAIREGFRMTRLDSSRAFFENGEMIAAQHIVLANGAEAFGLLPPHGDGKPAGEGEKGQAAILRLAPGVSVEEQPLIFSDRLYVVPRGADSVAIGATSERVYDSATATDTQLERLIERARDICPALEGATVQERWARLRPRSADRKLLVAPHPRLENVTVATGGFKTGLAMAHQAAETVASIVCGAKHAP